MKYPERINNLTELADFLRDTGKCDWPRAMREGAQ